MRIFGAFMMIVWFVMNVVVMVQSDGLELMYRGGWVAVSANHGLAAVVLMSLIPLALGLLFLIMGEDVPIISDIKRKRHLRKVGKQARQHIAS